jgi:conjugative relaxase-like TrwC/TraI family protein
MLSSSNVSAGKAEHYYSKDDYYTQEESERSPAYWYGQGAETLGLSGDVEKTAFTDLLYGIAPDATYLGGRLVNPEKHRAATDYTFSAPKSVSIAGLVQKDEWVIEAHHRAVKTALSVIEMSLCPDAHLDG